MLETDILFKKIKNKNKRKSNIIWYLDGGYEHDICTVILTCKVNGKCEMLLFLWCEMLHKLQRLLTGNMSAT